MREWARPGSVLCTNNKGSGSGRPRNIWVLIRNTVYHKWLAKCGYHVLVRRSVQQCAGRWSTSVTIPPPALLRHSPALGRSSRAVSSTSQVKSRSYPKSRKFFCFYASGSGIIVPDPDLNFLTGKPVQFLCTFFFRMVQFVFDYTHISLGILKNASKSCSCPHCYNFSII